MKLVYNEHIHVEIINLFQFSSCIACDEDNSRSVGRCYCVVSIKGMFFCCDCSITCVCWVVLWASPGNRVVFPENPTGHRCTPITPRKSRRTSERYAHSKHSMEFKPVLYTCIDRHLKAFKDNVHVINLCGN